MTQEANDTRPRIVVGVDGSEPAKAALRWALRQAERTGAVLEAVSAWEWPNTFGWAPAIDEDFEELAAQVLRDTLAEVSGAGGQAEVRTKVVEGNPARVLLDASHGAELLVVGSRGLGGFSGALLGSVGQHCVQHARCPVVIVRGEDHDGTEHRHRHHGTAAGAGNLP